jgi:hypothetical protein
MTSLALENYRAASQPWTQEQRNDETHKPSHITLERNEINATLEPTDGGASAWKLLFASFLFEALLWGGSSDQLLVQQY